MINCYRHIQTYALGNTWDYMWNFLPLFKTQKKHYLDYIFICDLSIQSKQNGHKISVCRCLKLNFGIKSKESVHSFVLYLSCLIE